MRTGTWEILTQERSTSESWPILRIKQKLLLSRNEG